MSEDQTGEVIGRSNLGCGVGCEGSFISRCSRQHVVFGRLASLLTGLLFPVVAGRTE
jgi:hypothetical protein